MFDTNAVIVVLAVVVCILAALVGVMASLLLKRHETADQNGSKRHTHRTSAGIEDAIAIALDYIGYADDLEMEATAVRQRTEKLQSVLMVLREGPHAYDPDKPAGKRPEALGK
jgi:hypothetical protein